MTVVLLSLVIVALLMGGMAIGVLMGREPLKGSCGGMSALGMDTSCDICGGDPQRCEKENEDQQESSSAKAQFYSADR